MRVTGTIDHTAGKPTSIGLWLDFDRSREVVVSIRVSDGKTLADAARAGGNTNVRQVVVPMADHVLKHEERSVDVIRQPRNLVALPTHYVADRLISEEVIQAIVQMVRPSDG